MAYVDEWRQWHAERVDALTAPFGPLASLCRGRMRQSATRSEVTGLTWENPLDDLRLDADDTAPLLRVNLGTPIRDATSYTQLTDQQRALFRLEGAYGRGLARVEDGEFDVSHGSLDVFAPHHDWVIPAQFHETDLRRVDVPSTKSGVETLALVGEVRFDWNGAQHALAVTSLPLGELHAVFTDLSRRDRFPFRFLHIEAPDDAGRTTLDFNRAVLPLAAFNDRIVAPTPPPQNVLQIAVTAGESHPHVDLAGLLAAFPPQLTA